MLSEMRNSVLVLIFSTLVCGSITSCTRPEERNAASEAPAPSDTVKLSPKAAERFGLSLVTVSEKSDVQSLTTTGEIKADENEVFHINSLTNGRVVKDNVILGDV